MSKADPLDRWEEGPGGCHIWLGPRDRRGYGKLMIRKRNASAHRARYEREIGPIPPGMDLDHYVCNNGRGGCCNPQHCRPASRRENVLRGDTGPSRNRAKTHCHNGHLLAGDNLLKSALRYGRRICRECHNAWNRSPEQRARRAAYMRNRRARRLK